MLVYLILEDATQETEHRSAMHSAPSVEVSHSSGMKFRSHYPLSPGGSRV